MLGAPFGYFANCVRGGGTGTIAENRVGWKMRGRAAEGDAEQKSALNATVSSSAQVSYVNFKNRVSLRLKVTTISDSPSVSKEKWGTLQKIISFSSLE